MPGLVHGRDEPRTGIGYQRRAGVGNEREVLTRIEPGKDTLEAPALIVGVQGHQRRLGPDVGGEHPRAPRILREDPVNLAERLPGSGTHVREVPDGRAHDV